MRFNKLIVNLLLFFVFFKAFSASAQFLEIGGGLGITHYKGEIYPNFKPFAFHGGSNAFVRYNFVKQGVSVKGTGMVGYLSAKDSRVNVPFNQARGFNFLTNVFDAGLQIEYNFLDFRSTAAHNSDWTPYVFGGFNYFGVFNGKYTVDNDVPYRLVQYEKVNKETDIAYAIPFGIGLKKMLRPRLNLSIEFGTRKTFNDVNIDNIGFQRNVANEIVPNFLGSVNAANSDERRASAPNTRLKDMYYYTNVSLSFVFYKVHCPPSR